MIPWKCAGTPAKERASYIAEALERRLLLVSFPGVSLQDEFNILGGGPTTSPCPDTMGAVGPNHFLEMIKGAVAVFDKSSGARLSITTLANFFTLTVGGTTYPRNGISDPHVLYDSHSGHVFDTAAGRQLRRRRRVRAGMVCQQLGNGGGEHGVSNTGLEQRRSQSQQHLGDHDSGLRK